MYRFLLVALSRGQGLWGSSVSLVCTILLPCALALTDMVVSLSNLWMASLGSGFYAEINDDTVGNILLRVC